MPTKTQYQSHLKVIAAISLSLLLLLTIPLLVLADFGTAFTYQGQITDSDGPVTGTCDLDFSLYDALTIGNQVGSTITKTNTSVSYGLFTVDLDFGSNAFTGDRRWLEINVDCGTGGNLLSPRQELTPTPYAIYAANVVTYTVGTGLTISNQVISVTADGLDFSEFADAMTVDITTTIDMDSNGADLNFDNNTLFIDSSENRVGLGTSSPQEQLHLAEGNLLQSPGNPTLVGTLGIGGYPQSVYVSGRYAYVVDADSNDLKVIDVSDPGSPSLAGSLGFGGILYSVYVSGRYAYVVDADSNDLKVIDVSNPITPSLTGSLGLGTSPQSVYVSGRYAYVVDYGSDDLKVIDVSGAEMTALMAHSLEAGNLQVRNDIVAQGQLQVTGGVNVGAAGLFSAGNVGISGTLRVNTLASASGTNLCISSDNELASCSSSRRYKQNINGLTLGLDTIEQLNPVTFQWQKTGESDVGFIAEEVAEVNPLFVTYKNGEIEGVKYKQLSTVFVNAFKEQQAQIEAFEGENEAQYAQIKALKGENEAQQAQIEALMAIVCLDRPEAEFCGE